MRDISPRYRRDMGEILQDQSAKFDDYRLRCFGTILRIEVSQLIQKLSKFL